MTDHKTREVPPTPRDFNKPSMSELIPIRSTKINILKSPIFYFVAATGIFTLVLFSGYFSYLKTQGNQNVLIGFGLITIVYLILSTATILYLYSKSDKPFLVYFAMSFIIFIVLKTNLQTPFFFLFRDVLPGSNNLSENPGFGSAFVGMFFGAGLMEELIKSLPGIIGASLALYGRELRGKIPIRIFDWIAVRGPLDGLMLGVFAGGMFIFIETGYQYFPRAIVQQGSGFVEALTSLMLLLPRVISGIVGHMGWAGITGYFIGLAVLRPAATKYAIAAWIGTSLLHAMWNTHGYVPSFAWISVGVGAVVFVACFLKARQLDQSMGRSMDSYGSVVVDPANNLGDPATAPSTGTTSGDGLRNLVGGLFSQIQGAVGNLEEQAVANTPAPLQRPQSLALFFDGVSLAIKPGAIDLGKLSPTLEGQIAEITQHPTRSEVLGLKNLGASTWDVTLRDGTSRTIESGRNVRLADGVSIELVPNTTVKVINMGDIT